MKKMVLVVAAAAASLWAGTADAALLKMTFETSPDASWQLFYGNRPYGLPATPIITGSITIDTAKVSTLLPERSVDWDGVQYRTYSGSYDAITAFDWTTASGGSLPTYSPDQIVSDPTSPWYFGSHMFVTINYADGEMTQIIASPQWGDASHAGPEGIDVSAVFADGQLTSGMFIGDVGINEGWNSFVCNSCVAVTSVQTLGDSPSAVPEPAMWVMMITGFGLVGFALRRQRQPVRVVYAR